MNNCRRMWRLNLQIRLKIFVWIKYLNIHSKIEARGFFIFVLDFFSFICFSGTEMNEFEWILTCYSNYWRSSSVSVYYVQFLNSMKLHHSVHVFITVGHDIYFISFFIFTKKEIVGHGVSILITCVVQAIYTSKSSSIR